MKAIIKNYPNRLVCHIFTNYMTKKYGYVDWPETYSSKEKFIEKIDDVIQYLYNIVNRVYYDRLSQKIDVKLDQWDTWSMDHTLSHIIVPMLKQLKETKHGAPNVDVEDVPEELWPSCKEVLAYGEDGTTDPNFFKRWDWILDEMIWAFEQKSLDNWEEQYYKYEDDPTAQFGVKCVWSDDEGRKAHQERMTNGFKLFGKYYESLWD